jgi:hypothetical protein
MIKITIKVSQITLWIINNNNNNNSNSINNNSNSLKMSNKLIPSLQIIIKLPVCSRNQPIIVNYQIIMIIDFPLSKWVIW